MEQIKYRDRFKNIKNGKIFTLYRKILKTKKAYMPTMENTKNVPSTTRIIYLITHVIYLVHDHLDLAIVWYTIVDLVV